MTRRARLCAPTAVVLIWMVAAACVDQTPHPKIMPPNGVRLIERKAVYSNLGNVNYRFYAGTSTFEAWTASFSTAEFVCVMDTTPVVFNELSCDTDEFLIAIYPSSEFRESLEATLPHEASWVVEYSYLG